jgi:ADP-ribose pyrophosphatase
MNTDNERRVLAEGKFMRLVAQSGWEWVERTNTDGAAVIAAVTDDDRMVFVEQYRVPMHCRVVELPAGLAGDEPDFAGEAMIETARRELFEETGYSGGSWQFAVQGPASPGLTTEAYSLYIARGVTKTGPGGGDTHEDIEVHAVPLSELDGWLDAKRKSGVIVEPKIYVGRYFLGST